MSATRFSNEFFEKIDILELKMARPNYFGSTLRIFLKFYPMEGVKRYMEIILMAFLVKISFGTNGPFWPENDTSS